MSFKADTRPVWATDNEYLTNDGGRCPACGDSDIQGEPVATGNAVAQQSVSCNACGAEWEDQYKMRGHL